MHVYSKLVVFTNICTKIKFTEYIFAVYSLFKIFCKKVQSYIPGNCILFLPSEISLHFYSANLLSLSYIPHGYHQLLMSLMLTIFFLCFNTARDILFTLPYSSVSRIIQQTKNQNFTHALE